MKKKTSHEYLQANVVGPLLRKYRLEAGLTQKELAARCREMRMNLTRSTLAKIESQVRFIKACELFIIAKILKEPLERFYPADYGVAHLQNPSKSF